MSPTQDDNNNNNNNKHADDFLQRTKTKVDLAFSPLLMIPGDLYPWPVTVTAKTLRTGWGLRSERRALACESAGVLGYRPSSNSYWMEHVDKRRYCLASAKVGDGVVGLIEDKGSEFYTVNIFAGLHCVLSRLAFEGATKRNKPELKRGGRSLYLIIKLSDKQMSSMPKL